MFNVCILVDVRAVVAHHGAVGDAAATSPGGGRLVFLDRRHIASVEIRTTFPPWVPLI